ASCDTKYHPVLAPVSRCYPDLVGRLPTCYSPVRRSFHIRPPEGFCMLPALDLHVLGTPPAFVLSQDQTLQKSLHTISKNNMSLSLLLKNGDLVLDIIGGSVQCSESKSYYKWWSLAGSNRCPPACEAGALPAELRPHKWSGRQDSNLRPLGPKPSALPS